MYKKILLPIDISETHISGKILSDALRYCRAFGAQLHVISVVPDFGMALVGSFFPEGFSKQALAQAKVALDEYIAASDCEGVSVECHVGFGNIYEEILEMSKEIDADLIIVSAARPELKDYLLGPNAARVVRHAECSVLVIRG